MVLAKRRGIWLLAVDTVFVDFHIFTDCPSEDPK